MTVAPEVQGSGKPTAGVMPLPEPEAYTEWQLHPDLNWGYMQSSSGSRVEGCAWMGLVAVLVLWIVQ